MHFRFLIFVLSVLFLAAAGSRAAEKNNATFQLTSPAFVDQGSMPSLYTCEGKNIAPPLVWSGAPAGIQSFALIVDDPDAPDPSAPKKTFVHWVLFNIPPNETSLPEGASPLPLGTGEGLNDWKETGYRGPCPPVGRHRYFFKLYALDAAYVPQKPLDKPLLEKAMQKHIVGQAVLVGTYQLEKQ